MIYRMQIPAGSTHNVDFGLQDSSGLYLNLAGYTARMMMRRDAAQPLPDFSFTDADRLSFVQASQQCRFITSDTDPLAIHSDNHEFAAGERVKFTTTGTLPGLTVGVTYYVSQKGLSPYSLEISETDGGDPIVSAAPQSGVHTVLASNSGVVRLSLPPSITSQMSGEYLYDIEIQAPSGDVYRVVEGLCSVSAEITR